MVDLETFPATQQLLALAGVPAAVAILVAVPPRGPGPTRQSGWGTVRIEYIPEGTVCILPLMRVLSLVSTKGGVGKTALAAALAVELDAVLLDLDPQASACRWRDRREAEAPLVTDVAPARLRPTLDALEAQGVGTVVIDTPPRSETAALEATRAADLVVVPVRAQMVDLETLPAVQQLLDLAGRPAAVAVLVGVPARGARAAQARTVIEGAGVTVCPQVLVHRAAWGDASALGLTVTEYEPRGRAAGELRSVAAWLSERCRR